MSHVLWCGALEVFIFVPLKFNGSITSARNHAEYDSDLVKKILWYHFKTRPSDFWANKLVSVLALSQHIDTMYEQMMRDVGEDWEPGEKSAKAMASSAKPMPKDIAYWFQIGRGVNTPLEGWRSPRQKMDASKESWYGANYADYPDPLTEEEITELFEQSPASSKFKGEPK